MQSYQIMSDSIRCIHGNMDLKYVLNNIIPLVVFINFIVTDWN